MRLQLKAYAARQAAYQVKPGWYFLISGPRVADCYGFFGLSKEPSIKTSKIHSLAYDLAETDSREIPGFVGYLSPEAAQDLNALKLSFEDIGSHFGNDLTSLDDPIPEVLKIIQKYNLTNQVAWSAQQFLAEARQAKLGKLKPLPDNLKAKLMAIPEVASYVQQEIFGAVYNSGYERVQLVCSDWDSDKAILISSGSPGWKPGAPSVWQLSLGLVQFFESHRVQAKDLNIPVELQKELYEWANKTFRAPYKLYAPEDSWIWDVKG